MSGTVVIGLGNPILSDDAVGLHVARALKAELAGIKGIVIKELHAGGMRVMDAIAGFERAVIVDAMRTGALRPGSVRRLEAGQLGQARNLASTHDTNLPTALALGRMLGLRMPSEVTTYGIESLEVETFGETLSEDVRRSVPEAVRLIALEVRSTPRFVIPAPDSSFPGQASAGIQGNRNDTLGLDSGPRITTFRGKLRRNDGFLRDYRP